MNETKTKVIRGCWQLSRDHSLGRDSIQPIIDSVNAGFLTFDCADIYLGVESLLGRARTKLKDSSIRVHTKFVPDLEVLSSINKQYVEKIIDRSLYRLKVDCLPLVQFHWWDWGVKNYMEALGFLTELKEAGKICEIGLTNVNQHYLTELSSSVEVSSLQAQISLFDTRVVRGISELCNKHNIKLFAYGALLGGFISEKWLAKEEPCLSSLANRSLVKYKLIIDEACGWEVFQKRLLLLTTMAKRYQCPLAALVISALIQGQRCHSVIAGLSPNNYKEQNLALMSLPVLEESDLQELMGWSCKLTGDPYELERNKKSLHAKIMKYSLNDSP